jgi:GNAT superfamily N-acetyltransferase
MTIQQNIPQAEPEEHDTGAGERVVVSLFRPEDGPGIARLFRAVYGDGYPVRTFYDPAALMKAFESGESYSVAARKAGGEVIGHVALFRSSPYPNLYEAGAGLVLPEYRKEGINRLLLTHLYDKIAPGLGVEEVWGEAVCNHITMQKAVQHYRHVETGLEVDLMPAEAYETEKSASGRVASLLCFRAYQAGHHSVYLPPIYEKDLRYLYSGLDDLRNLAVSNEELPDGVFSHATSQTFEFARVVRIAVERIGVDFESYWHALENDILLTDVRVVQVWLNLACPCVGHAVSVLRDGGYFFGGLLPRWFDDDGLLMQKIIGRPDWEGIHLFSDRAGDILGMVRSDWEQVGNR